MTDYSWLEALHQSQYDMLVRLAASRLLQSAASVSEAEDIVQQAFLLAAEKDLRNHPAPVGWLIRTVCQLCRKAGIRAHNALKKHQRAALQVQSPAPGLTGTVDIRTECPVGEKEFRLLMEQLLSPEECQLLIRYCTDETPLHELAADYSLSSGALRVRIHRIRKKLKACYAGSEGGEA